MICNSCFGRALAPLPPGKVLAVTPYEDVGKELIRRFKFDGDAEAGRLCARYMARLVHVDDYDVAVAVTTTAARKRQRGYDQSVLLAKWIAREVGLPFVPALVRVKNVHQIGQGRLERLAQSKGLYAAVNTKRIICKRVLLVDDVTTTGATMAAAREVLLEAGAGSVMGLAFAEDVLSSKKDDVG